MRLFFIILFGVNFSLVTNAQKNSNLIEWSVEQQLEWSNFKAKPNKSVKAEAQTGNRITFELQQLSETTFQIIIKNYFDKKDSWVKEKTNYLLNHEQKHSDVSEIFARKIRKGIVNGNYKNAKELVKKVELIYKKYMIELNAFQKAYDSETNHSINEKAQTIWNKKNRRGTS